jgi:hypothetical protein
MTLEEFQSIRESLRKQARVWLGGEACDQLERLFTLVEKLLEQKK